MEKVKERRNSDIEDAFIHFYDGIRTHITATMVLMVLTIVDFIVAYFLLSTYSISIRKSLFINYSFYTLLSLAASTAYSIFGIIMSDSKLIDTITTKYKDKDYSYLVKWISNRSKVMNKVDIVADIILAFIIGVNIFGFVASLITFKISFNEIITYKLMIINVLHIITVGTAHYININMVKQWIDVEHKLIEIIVNTDRIMNNTKENRNV